MKRIALFFVITGLMMACTEPGADDLESRVTALEEVTIESLKTQIQTIEGSLGEYKTTQEQLSAYVTELQGRVGTLEGETYTGLKTDIDGLKGRADAFDTALSSLESYVNQKGSDLQQWVKDYYTSLEMFNELKGTVTGISASITGIVGRLNGLDETTAGIAKDLKDKTDKLTGDLAKCREDIDGILVTLSGIAGSIENIEKEIAALISAVQSIVVVPDYSDGSVKMTDRAVNEMRFEVYPLESAKKLADAGVSAFSLDCVETETKASIFTNIPLTGVSFDGEVITVVANGEGLSDAIKAEVQPANARLRISDGTVTRSSEYFQLAYSVAPVALSVTVGAEHISALSAVLKGKANLGSPLAKDVMIGFQFFKSSDTFTANTATTVLAAGHDEDNYYSVGVTGLDPDTKYLYCSFVRVDGQDYYGETMEFETGSVASMLETLDASDIEASSAVLNAKLDLTDVLYSSIDYGFADESADYINVDGEFVVYGQWGLRGSDISEDAFTALITRLQHRSQCSYKAYVIVDGRYFCGEVKSFTTDWIPVSSISISLDKSENTFHTIGEYALITATVLPNDATDQSVTWSSDNESVAKPSMVMNEHWERVPGIIAVGNGTATITATANDGSGVSATCEVEVKQLVTSITLSKTYFPLLAGAEETISVTSILPDNANDKTYTWSSSDNTIAVVDQNGNVTVKAKGNASINATANDGSEVFASCGIVVYEPYTAVAGEAVDLGLSVKWSSMNLGATSPTEYGDYFAWGETYLKDNYSWSTYKFGTSSSGPFSKYNTDGSYGDVDNKAVLDPEDDVAHVTLGGNWRMPTDAEWTELREQCTWTWTTQNGVNGRMVTSKTNGNSIFLPAAGFRDDTNLGAVGSYGRYWSSSLNADNPYHARRMYFNSGNVYGSSGNRYLGQSVRPVTE